MCGIVGIYNLSRKPVSTETIKQMCQVMIHRGPDDEGFLVKGNIGLGMRRLKIIDLETGQQPIHNEDKSVWVILNGEIYNYKALRQELEARGHKFYTNSDTETIVHLYEDYGEDCAEKLNGMFGFAIWDEHKQKLLIFRDRIGIKPLHYWLDKQRLIFASEIKSILQHRAVVRRVEHKALNYYLSFQFVPAPYTMFEGIKKLLPGHMLICTADGIKTRKYWELNYQPQTDKSETYYLEKLRELLEDSVRLRLASDVPLGAFLSGGIDSSSVVGLMHGLMDKPVKTFSIGFADSAFNELGYARLVADKFHTEHHEFKVAADIVDFLPKFVWHTDEPFAIVSALPTYVVSKMARQHVSVALTGDGGDELFAGYERYWSESLAEYYAKLPLGLRNNIILPLLKLFSYPLPADFKLRDYLEKTIKKTRLLNMAPDERYIQHFYAFDKAAKEQLYHSDMAGLLNHDPADIYRGYFEHTEGYDSLDKRLYVDIKTCLPDHMLTKVDRMSMAVSLEARVPFLDHRLVEFSATIPPSLKMTLMTLKALVKNAMCELLPREILKRHKQGFLLPIDSWFRHELRDYAQEFFSDATLREQNFFAPKYVKQLLHEHLENKKNHGERLFMLILFQIWYKQNFKR